MFSYNVRTGELMQGDKFIGTGYSGKEGLPRNNPEWEAQENLGPIPRGKYLIGVSHNNEKLGPCVLSLSPCANTKTFGRFGFKIHGDNMRHDASHGCIILGPAIRQFIAQSDDFDLEVT